MKLSTLALIFAATTGSLLAVETGDTYQKVIEEKGAPASKMEAGGTTVLKYPDMTIKLREGKVIGIKGAGDTGAPAAAAGASQTSGPAIAAGQWTTDYAAALRQAKAEKKKIFLFFTGSDWCGWCKKFDKEILSTQDFKTFAGTNLLLVKLDFPRGTPQSPQLKAANQKLAQQYGIQGFPTVIVLNSEGKNVGELGYMEGGPKPFLGALKKL
ncbi:MAG: thioredoxin family protein [Nibricoccus sp.]